MRTPARHGWSVGLIVLALARLARAQTPAPVDEDSLLVSPAEPPEDAADDADAITPREGSTDAGDVEVGLGADGDGGGVVHPRRRVRFRDGALGGDLRSGVSDPLAGGALSLPIFGGEAALGRASPRWGRGLAVGAPADPWRDARSAEGVPAPRSRSLDGAGWRRVGAVRGEVAGGMIGHERVAIARVGTDIWDAGVVWRGGGAAIASLAASTRRDGFELAIDRGRAWRAEGSRSGTAGPLAWGLRARQGSEGFTSPGAVAGREPARASALELGGHAPFGWHALASLWCFRSGVGGSRLALEVDRELAHHDRVALGAEEQHGVRRDGTNASSGMRQVGWIEWHGGRGPVRLGLRDEIGGRRSFARDAVRVVSTARVVFDPGAGLDLAITRSAYRVASGEDVYLAEAGSDRWLLRAVHGSGTDTRLECSLPLAGGRGRAALTRIDDIGRSPRPHWSIDWTRSTRVPRDPARAGP